MIEKPWPDVLTLFTNFYDFSVSRDLSSKTEKHPFGAVRNEGLAAAYIKGVTAKTKLNMILVFTPLCLSHYKGFLLIS